MLELLDIILSPVTGGTLQHLLSKTKGLHPSVVASYTKQLIQGVRYLHVNRIIHRNLCGELSSIKCKIRCMV